jgi:hypothetical protein
MSKAYDRVELLTNYYAGHGFPINDLQQYSQLCDYCFVSPLINGKPSPTFFPQRGLRQGDPLSPYLFILWANVLSGLINQAQNNKIIHGIKIAHGAPEISHLLFADDSLFFL